MNPALKLSRKSKLTQLFHNIKHWHEKRRMIQAEKLDQKRIIKDNEHTLKTLESLAVKLAGENRFPPQTPNIVSMAKDISSKGTASNHYIWFMFVHMLFYDAFERTKQGDEVDIIRDILRERIAHRKIELATLRNHPDNIPADFMCDFNAHISFLCGAPKNASES